MDDIVIMDNQGRLVIPSFIRKRLKTNLFIISMEGDEIRLKPVGTATLLDYIDKIEVDVDDFTDTHKLRLAAWEE